MHTAIKTKNKKCGYVGSYPTNESCSLSGKN